MVAPQAADRNSDSISYIVYVEKWTTISVYYLVWPLARAQSLVKPRYYRSCAALLCWAEIQIHHVQNSILFFYLLDWKLT